jgi:transcription elongation GreA/GreB family factor
MSNLKQQLYVLCGQYIRTHEADIRTAIADAQEAAANESKSGGTGDSETGREVMQQEIELNLTRLNEINKLKTALDSIPFDHTSQTIQPGSVVKTNNGNYYLGISAGQLKVDGNTYYAVSPASPIGSKMIDMKTGDTFSLNGKEYMIESVT